MSALLAAVAFTWFGMVLAISFVEAPLKFRAPGVTIPIGLGIGRIVFRALNGLESALAIVAVVALVTGTPSTSVLVSAVVPIAVLVVQLVAVRPALNRRSDRVLAGEEGPRSHAHLWYVGLEVIKIATLLWLGVGASLA